MTKLLFDQNISYRICKKVKADFPDSFHVSDCQLLDTEDIEIWSYAKKNELTIVTFDADFYEISIFKGHPPKIIWLRTGNLTTNEVSELMRINKLAIVDFITDTKFESSSCLEIG